MPDALDRICTAIERWCDRAARSLDRTAGWVRGHEVRPGRLALARRLLTDWRDTRDLPPGGGRA